MTLLARAKAIWKLFTTGGLSKADKWVLVLALLYCLSPIDIIPDVVPVFGFLDDILVLLLALRRFSNKAMQESASPIHVEVKDVEAKVV